jgi:hypothetical protein
VLLVARRFPLAGTLHCFNTSAVLTPSALRNITLHKPTVLEVSTSSEDGGSKHLRNTFSTPTFIPSVLYNLTRFMISRTKYDQDSYSFKLLTSVLKMEAVNTSETL